MTRGETAVATKLVQNLLKRGYALSVYDGEEWTVAVSENEAVILEALGTTDSDVLRARETKGGESPVVGNFTLIYGNDPKGTELIADYTENKLCNAVWNEVLSLDVDA